VSASVACFTRTWQERTTILITPSPERDRGNGPETRPETKPSGRGDVVPNLSALAGTFALQGGEEVRI